MSQKVRMTITLIKVYEMRDKKMSRGSRSLTTQLGCENSMLNLRIHTGTRAMNCS
jgi:hypothetical protein